MAIPKPKAPLIDFDEMLGIETQHDTAPAPVQVGIVDMDFSLMESFPNHRFKLYEGQQLTDMVDSICQFGILLPIILWYTEDGRYIILSGHNRKNAAQLAGFAKGPVIIRENLTYEDAVLIVTETNLRQRSFSDMSHSERAYCLAQHYEAMKCQGKRNDLLAEIEMLLNPQDTSENETLAEPQTRFRTDAKLGQDYGLSRDKVAKYIRISNLIEPLIFRVDSGEIAFLAAYDLSFVEDEAQQQRIADLMESDSFKLDTKKAELFHGYYKAGKLTGTAIVQILSGEKTRKPKSNKPQPVKIKPAVISKYFTAQQTQKEIEEVIDKALALYFENQESEVTA